jgi:hypothetical protein
LPQDRLGDLGGLSKNILDGQMGQSSRFLDFIEQVIRDRKWDRFSHANKLQPWRSKSSANPGPARKWAHL